MQETEGRPGLAIDWRQLCVLVLDGSTGMTWVVDDPEGGYSVTKAQAVNIAVRDLISRFKVIRTAHNFSLAVVKFHEYVADEMPPRPVVEIDVYGDYDPTSGGSGGPRFIGSGLERAGEICERFLSEQDDGVAVSAVIILVVDGECRYPARTKEIAKELKKNSPPGC